MEEYYLPIILNGRTIYGDELRLEYDRQEKIRISLPNVKDNHLLEIGKLSGRELHKVNLDEIISFLSQVGELWENKNYHFRKEAAKISSLTTGYHERMIQHSYDMIPKMLNKKFLIETVNIEIGNKEFLDRWIKVGGTRVHALPLGKLLHIVAGNVPIVSILSFVMGILTKNINIIKVASGDPATFIYFALSFEEIDKNHPVNRTTSTLYWRHNADVERKCINIVDGLLVWGSFDALYSIRKKSKPGQAILEFGPRRSFIFVGEEVYKDISALEEISQRIVHDLSLYDQQACHSPQVIFFEGNAEKFCEAIAKTLEKEKYKLPKGFTSIDEKASITHERMMARFRGDKVFHPSTTEWTVILTKDFENTKNHPLSRTLYVVEVENLKEAVKYIDRSVMVVAFSSYERLEELKEDVFLRGADRVTMVGRMGYFPLGHPQEGKRNLSQLVKWVGADVI
ncbi:MAG: hypothetical protein DRN25_03045 [Thermoplasmata archaeon]|nr:MAG: hypothetical protein DRN25_03045 [Thermoplasmata archaeon]